MTTKKEVVCKICGKSIYRIFVEHIEHELEELEKVEEPILHERQDVR